MQEMQVVQVQSLGQEDPLQEGMVTHSIVLAWRIPWTEEPAGCSPWGHMELITTEDGVLTRIGNTSKCLPCAYHRSMFHV